MNKRQILLIIAIVVIIAVIIFLIVVNKKEETKSLEIKNIKVSEVTRSVFYAPQYVAINEGFYEKNGLNIELTTGSGADTVMTAVLSNQCEVGFAGPESSIYVYNEGKEDYTQVFAQLTKKDGSFLISRTENKEFKWEHVKGTTIIPGRKGGVPYMTLEYVLKKHGINPQKDVCLDDSIKFDLMAGAFSAGTADYVTLFEPTASSTQQQKKGYIVASVGEEAGEIPYTAYFAKKSYISSNEETIKKFTKSVYEGQKWVKEHSSREIAEKIQSFFPSTDISSLETSVQSYKDIDAWNDTPVLTKESFDRLQEVMTMAGELEKEAPYEKIINNQFANEVIR